MRLADNNIKTTVIFVTYLSEDKITFALDAIEDACVRGNLSCIVVDNASHDQTVEIIKKRYSWVTLVENKENMGYGRGLNVGLSTVTTPYTLFMNPDTVFPYAEIKKLESFMSQCPQAGIAAPSILRANGEYQIAGELLTPLLQVKYAVGKHKKNRTIVPDGKAFKTDWLCGAILFTRTSLMQKLKGFDPVFFLYFEETDLCRRVLKAGYELWAVGESKASHDSNSSARKLRPGLTVGGCLYEHYYPSRYYYLKKHFGAIPALVTEMMELFFFFLEDIVRLLLRKKVLNKLKTRLQYPIFTIPKE